MWGGGQVSESQLKRELLDLSFEEREGEAGGATFTAHLRVMNMVARLKVKVRPNEKHTFYGRRAGGRRCRRGALSRYDQAHALSGPPLDSVVGKDKSRVTKTTGEVL